MLIGTNFWFNFIYQEHGNAKQVILTGNDRYFNRIEVIVLFVFTNHRLKQLRYTYNCVNEELIGL